MFRLFKRNPVKVLIVPPTLELRITAGKVTRPPVHVTDPQFDTSKWLRTNLGETFARAKEQQRQNKPRSAA